MIRFWIKKSSDFIMKILWLYVCFSSVQLFSCVRLFVTPWTTARQASLSISNSQSLLKLMSIESVVPSNHLILCRPLFLPPSTFPSIRVFSNESALCIRWPKCWSFSFNIGPRCPSTDEWIKKICYMFSMEYYPAIKRNEIGSFVEMWMD